MWSHLRIAGGGSVVRTLHERPGSRFDTSHLVLRCQRGDLAISIEQLNTGSWLTIYSIHQGTPAYITCNDPSCSSFSKSTVPSSGIPAGRYVIGSNIFGSSTTFRLAFKNENFDKRNTLSWISYETFDAFLFHSGTRGLHNRFLCVPKYISCGCLWRHGNGSTINQSVHSICIDWKL